MLAEVSTHSRPKAADEVALNPTQQASFNTQPPEGGWPEGGQFVNHVWFQHTAARRRLRYPGQVGNSFYSFNTQPPEGGWVRL